MQKTARQTAEAENPTGLNGQTGTDPALMLQYIRNTAGFAAALEPNADAYQAALAHSAFVRKMKVFLPVLAAIISAAFIIVSIIRTYLPETLSVESARIE